MSSPSDPSPIVSVIIPAHNPGDWIIRALESAMGQTLESLEVILVDDASTDGLEERIRAYRDRLIYLRLEDNLGPAAARNAGIARSKGRYIAPLDADDFWEPDRLAKLVDFLERNPDYGLVTSDIVKILDDGTRLPHYGSEETRFRPNDQDVWILRHHFILSSHSVFRREMFEKHGGYDESFWRGEDWDLEIRLLTAGEKAAMYPEVLSYVRVTADSMTQRGPWEEDLVRLLEKWADKPLTEPQKIAVDHTLKRARWNLAKRRIWEGRHSEARQILRGLVRTAPGDIRLKAGLWLYLPRGTIGRIHKWRRDYLIRHNAPFSLERARELRPASGDKGIRGYIWAVVLHGEHRPAVRAWGVLWLLLPPLRPQIWKQLSQ